MLSLGTYESDYQLAQYVLSQSNCVTLNELKSYSIQQGITSPQEDGVTSFDAIDYNDHSEDDDLGCVPRSLQYDIIGNSVEAFHSTPGKGDANDLSRLHQKSHLCISPFTKSLHATIAENSPSKIHMHSEDFI